MTKRTIVFTDWNFNVSKRLSRRQLLEPSQMSVVLQQTASWHRFSDDEGLFGTKGIGGTQPP